MNWLDLVRKRHEGDGWLVFNELANRVSFGSKTIADAFALGVWSSTKYEGHLYERKISRGDLRRELKDPSKAEGVGKYAKYWWLVLDAEIKIDDLVIPDQWGILVPTVRGGTQLLTVQRKAPAHKVKPFDPSFVIAMIRNGLKGYVQKSDHDRVVEAYEAKLAGKDAPPTDEEISVQEKLWKTERELKNLRADIERFEEASGVKLSDQGWAVGNIGRAVKIVRLLQDRDMSIENLGSHVAMLSRIAHDFDQHARAVARTAVDLRVELGLHTKDHADTCRKMRSWGGGECTCGKDPRCPLEAQLQRQTSGVTTPDGDGDATSQTPAPGDDDEGGGVDRGGAGADEQDAGPQLRDHGEQVHHGQPAS